MRPLLRRLSFLLALLCAPLALAGCIPIPNEGSVVGATAPEPVAAPISAGEKIVVVAASAEDDNAHIPACVRQELEDYLGLERMADAAAFRQAAGNEFSVGDLESRSDAELSQYINENNIRFVAQIEIGKDYASGQVGYTAQWAERSVVNAQIFDRTTGKLLSPTMVDVYGSGGGLLIFYEFTWTETPACRNLAAIIASTITSRPLEDFEPELAAISAKTAAKIEADVGKQRNEYLDFWIPHCVAALSGRVEAIGGYNALWIATSYEFGTAPTGADPVAAYSWYALAIAQAQDGTITTPAVLNTAALAREQLTQLRARFENEGRLAEVEARAESLGVGSPVCNGPPPAADVGTLIRWGEGRNRLKNWCENEAVGHACYDSKLYLTRCLAAISGDVQSRWYVGSYYANGWDSFEKDLVEAYKWYRLSLSTTSSSKYEANVEYDVEQIRHKMTSAEIAEAERRAAEWWPDPSQCVAALETAEGS